MSYPSNTAMDGAQIRADRIARRWTQKDAAERAGVSHKTWVQAEMGRPLRAATRAAILDAIASAEPVAVSTDEFGFEDLALAIPKLPLSDLNRLMDMVRTAIAIREGGVG